MTPALTEPSAAARSALTITVVVCTYTERRWLQLTELLESLSTQEVDQVLVVVDHAPVLLERVREAFPAVTALASTGPQGLSGARNTGVAAATGDVVAFVDDDARPRPDFIEQLLAAYDERTLGVGGRAEPAWERDRPAWFPPAFDWVVGCSHQGLPERRAELRNLIGAAMSFRLDVLRGTGGFDSSLGRVGAGAAGCEETELCLRLAKAHPAGRMVYEPAAVVDHLVPVQRATLRYFVRRCWAEGRSKAHVTRLAGAGSATSAERDYTRKVLPLAVLRALRAGLFGQPARALAAPVVALGLTVTLLGYLSGFVRR